MTYHEKIPCKTAGCMTRLTWDEQRKQFGRFARAIGVEKAKEYSPRCGKCTTQIIREGGDCV